MIKYASVAIACLTTGGCAGPMLAAGASMGVGWAVTAEGDVKVADGILAADKPAKQAICTRELPSYHPVWFQTWCDHLPSDVDGLAEQWLLVGLAETE